LDASREIGLKNLEEKLRAPRLPMVGRIAISQAGTLAKSGITVFVFDWEMPVKLRSTLRLVSLLLMPAAVRKYVTSSQR